MKTIGFIGGGNMAQVLIEGVLKAELFGPDDVWVSDVRSERLNELHEKYGIKTTQDNRQLAEHADIIVLSVKPQVMTAVLCGLIGQIKPDAFVISIAAGITTDSIRQRLGDAQIIRVMPNTPALVGVGASGIFAGSASKEASEAALRIFASVGKAVLVEREELIDAVTAVSGSGPAYFFLLMEEMIKAAVALGLEENVAMELVLQTAKGSLRSLHNWRIPSSRPPTSARLKRLSLNKQLKPEAQAPGFTIAKFPNHSALIKSI